jgi:hypothetical protein
MRGDINAFEIAALIALAAVLASAGAARGATRGSDCDIARLDDALFPLAQPQLRE